MSDNKNLNAAYASINNKYSEIVEKEPTIGDMLGHFIVNGKSVGYGVYNDDNFSFDIEFPEDISPFNYALGTIEDDVNDIKTLIRRVNLTINMCEDCEDEAVRSKLVNMKNKLTNMKSDREIVYSKLKELSREVEEDNNKESISDMLDKTKNDHDDNSINTGGGGGAGGSTKGHQVKGDVKLSDTFSSLSNTYDNVKAYENVVANKLSNIVVNGKAIGEGIFNTHAIETGDLYIPTNEEIIDAYDALLDDISNLNILKGQYSDAIIANNLEIAELKKVEPTPITGIDEFGNVITIGYDYTEYDAAQLRIAAAEAENEVYAAKVAELTTRLTDVNTVKTEFDNYINALSKANPELSSAFDDYNNKVPFSTGPVTESNEGGEKPNAFNDNNVDPSLLAGLPDNVLAFVHDNPNVDLTNTPLSVLEYLASHPNVDPTNTLNYFGLGKDVIGDKEFNFVTDNYERIINGKVIWFYKDGKKWDTTSSAKGAKPNASGFVLLPGNDLSMYAATDYKPNPNKNNNNYEDNKVALPTAISNLSGVGGNAFGLPNGITYVKDQDGNTIFLGDAGSDEYNKIKSATNTALKNYTNPARGIDSLSTLCMGPNGLYTIDYHVGDSYNDYINSIKEADPNWACLGYYNIVNPDGTFNEAFRHDPSKAARSKDHSTESYLVDGYHTRSFVGQTDSGLVVMGSTTDKNRMYLEDEYNLVHGLVSDNINLLVNGDGGSSTYQLYYSKGKLTANSLPTSDQGYKRNNWLIVGKNG